MSKPLAIEHLPTDALRPYARNARTHSPKQISQIAASISKFGFNNPVLIDREAEIIPGHGRVAAAKRLGSRARKAAINCRACSRSFGFLAGLVRA